MWGMGLGSVYAGCLFQNAACLVARIGQRALVARPTMCYPTSHIHDSTEKSMLPPPRTQRKSYEISSNLRELCVLSGKTLVISEESVIHGELVAFSVKIYRKCLHNPVSLIAWIQLVGLHFRAPLPRWGSVWPGREHRLRDRIGKVW